MKIAVLFPGQGSQAPGMGHDFFTNFETAKNIFSDADKTLGYSLSSLCFNGPQEDLNLTANTQPALLTTSVAMASVLRETLDIPVAYTAGHSLGEYTALWFAGSLSFQDAVTLVHKRGKAMQEATPAGVGAMAAIIGLDSASVDSICKAIDTGVVQTANFNGPGQVVISGNKAAVEKAADTAKEAGAKRAILLPVSAPFHCQLMSPAADIMEKELNLVDVLPPQIPLINNVDAKELPGDANAVRSSLVRQVTSSVRWQESIEYMVSQGVDTFIEIGAGRVLSNLVKRIARKTAIHSINNVESLNKIIETIRQAL